MLESTVERHLREEAKKRKGTALKFVSPGMNGVPDRIVLMPDGKMAFVELKAPGKKPTAPFPLSFLLSSWSITLGL